MHTFVSRKGSVYRVCVDVRLSQKCARRGGFLVIRPESVGGDIGATSQIGPVSPDSRFRDGLHSSAIAVYQDLANKSACHQPCRVQDRKSTRLNSKSLTNLVCRLLLEKKKNKQQC